MSERLLTATELAERWGLAVKTIYNWHCAESFPHPVKPLKLGLSLRFRLREVEAAEQADRLVLVLSGDEGQLLHALLASETTRAAKALRKKVEQARGRILAEVS